MKVLELEELRRKSSDRFQMWTSFINKNEAKHLAEIGVFRGDFAAHILTACKGIEEYIMVDPWKNLDDWNKPANVDEDIFEMYYRETLERTEFASEKRKVLKGRTTEVINQIPDGSLDFVYIDGDHTLKGISIDLISLWPKVKEGGYIAGDDLSPTIWQHDSRYEPSMVFPFAVYFAEAVNAPVYALPMNQFLIERREGFEFKDLTSNKEYNDITLLSQFNKRPPSHNPGNIFTKFAGRFLP